MVCLPVCAHVIACIKCTQKYTQTAWPVIPEIPQNPEKPLKWLIPLKRSLKYPENWDGPRKKYEKMSVKIGI